MKQISILFIALLILSGCTAAQKTVQDPSAANTLPGKADQQSATTNLTTESSSLATVAKEMIIKKEDPFKVLEIYKKMIAVYPAKSMERQDVLRYIMDSNLAMVKEKKGSDALRLAMELDRLIPNDFYVQNRVIGAYRVLAEDQIENKNLVGAMELVIKGLQVRYDVEIMHTNLKLLTLMAQDDIKNNKIESAKKRLNEVLYIIDAQDTPAEKTQFAAEGAEATGLLSTL